MRLSKPPEKFVRLPLLCPCNECCIQFIFIMAAAIANFDVLALSIMPSAPVRRRKPKQGSNYKGFNF
jgi:hypothetical protein